MSLGKRKRWMLSLGRKWCRSVKSMAKRLQAWHHYRLWCNMEAMPELSTRTPDFLPLMFPDEQNLRKLSKLKSRKERILFWIHPNLEIITRENHPILRPLTCRFPIIEQIEALQMRSQFQVDSLVITAKVLWKKLKRCLLSSK